MNRPFNDSKRIGRVHWHVVISVIGGVCLSATILWGYVYIAADRAADGFFFVNNTAQQLTIDVAGNYGVVPSGQQTVLPPNNGDFSIQTEGGENWRYHMTAVDRRKFPNSRADKHSIIFQVEPDGSVYLLYSKALEPVQELPPQPEGYPLRPLKFPGVRLGGRGE